MRHLFAPLALVILIAAAGGASAQPEPVTVQPKLDLTHVKQPVHFGDAKVTITPTDRYYYLRADDARSVLLAWGNPPEVTEGVMGMLFPEGMDPLDRDSWGVVISYEDIGYVTDDDAATTDYAKILSDMQSALERENATFASQGYPPMHLKGWAAPPSYDAASHVVTWAKDLETEGVEGHSLNYNIRVLGRKGVLVLNVVSPLENLGEVQELANSLRGMTAFDSGQTYADHRSNDKMAGIGVAGLVAGGAGVLVAKKAGLLAVLAIVLKKGFVFIAGGIAAAWASIQRFFGRKPKRKDAPPSQSDDNSGGGDIVS